MIDLTPQATVQPWRSAVQQLQAEVKRLTAELQAERLKNRQLTPERAQWKVGKPQNVLYGS